MSALDSRPAVHGEFVIFAENDDLDSLAPDSGVAYPALHCSEITGETTSRRADLNQFQWKSHCRGLYQLPAAA